MALSLLAFLFDPRSVARAQDAPNAPSTGRVTGTVTLSTTLARRRPNFRIYSDPGPGSIPPQTRTDPAAELRNVVVYIESVPLSAVSDVRATSDPAPPTMPQSGEKFIPHVLPVLRGTTVAFPNEDDVYHNVFSLSGAATFDLGRYPRGTSRPWTFNKPGTVQVFCHIHSDMSAVVLVLNNQFFATPDQAGKYTIPNLAPGTYTLVAWHERIRAVTRKFTVVAGQAIAIDFNIPLPDASP